MEVIYQVANREWKLWGRGGKQAAEYGLFRNKNLAFYASGYVNENQGWGVTHNHKNFAYRVADILSKEKTFKACPEMSYGFHYLSDKA